MFYADSDSLIRFDQTVSNQFYALDLGETIDSIQFDPRRKIAEKHTLINNPNSIKPVEQYYFQIKPNPASSILYLTVNEVLVSECQIFNFNGQLVETVRIDSLVTAINIELWSRGIYFIKLGSRVEKIIVE